MPVSVETFTRVALEDPEGKWELLCGRLRQKPPMTMEHDNVILRLNVRLVRQLDEQAYVVSPNLARLRLPDGRYFLPDLCVVPRGYAQRLLASPRSLQIHEGPALLVVEVWSPSTGDYDTADKLPGYQARGDAEIWLLHPYDKTLTRWLRQTDGSYREEQVTAATVQPAALPGVTITISELFE